MVKLVDWQILNTSLTDYALPEHENCMISGLSIDHPDIRDGTQISVSMLDKVLKKIVKTVNADCELIGPPDPNYTKWCKNKYPNYNLEDPFNQKVLNATITT